jgi:two-component system response regulator HydG
VVQSLMRLPWVGNASELAQALKNAIAVSKTNEFDISDFAFLVSASKSKIRRDKNLRIKEKEKQMVIKALEKHLGNISRAASELGITRQALYRRMEKHGITAFGVS